jgi:hypothetical protein
MSRTNKFISTEDIYIYPGVARAGARTYVLAVWILWSKASQQAATTPNAIQRERV